MPVATKARHARPWLGVGRLVFAGYLLTVATVFVAAYGAYASLEASEQARRSKESVNAAARMAAQLAARIEDRAAVVGAMAAEASLVAALQGGQSGAIEEARTRLRRVFLNVAHVRLLTADAPSHAAEPPLGYACLELARQAGQGVQPPVEAHVTDRGGFHLDIVRPVIDAEGGVIGSLMVTLGPQDLQSLLDHAAAGEHGYFEVRQKSSGAPLTLVSHGKETLRNRHFAAAAPIQATPWELALWAEEEGGPLQDHERYLAVLGAALGGALLLFALWSWFAARRVSRQLAALMAATPEPPAGGSEPGMGAEPGRARTAPGTQSGHGAKAKPQLSQEIVFVDAKEAEAQDAS